MKSSLRGSARTFLKLSSKLILGRGLAQYSSMRAGSAFLWLYPDFRNAEAGNYGTADLAFINKVKRVTPGFEKSKTSWRHPFEGACQVGSASPRTGLTIPPGSALILRDPP